MMQQHTGTVITDLLALVDRYLSPGGCSTPPHPPEESVRCDACEVEIRELVTSTG